MDPFTRYFTPNKSARSIRLYIKVTAAVIYDALRVCRLLLEKGINIKQGFDCCLGG